MLEIQTIKQHIVWLGLIFLLLVYLFCSHSVFALDQAPALKDHNKIIPTEFQQSKEVDNFIDYMVSRHGFSQDALTRTFNQVQLNNQSIQLIKPPPASKPKNWHAYRARFVEPIRIAAGVEFWNKYANVLHRAEKQFGVPAEIIVGIIGIETTFGKNLGNFRTLDVLSTLAFSYPESPYKEKRMLYFREELEQFLLLARESGVDPFSIVGSYAGAIGWPQFMPSNIRQHAIDFDSDGKIDLHQSPADAIGSVANFLVQHGWQTDLPLVFPATTTNLKPETMIAKELNATFTLQQLANAAVPSQKNTPLQLQYGLIDLQNGQAATQYWLATQNFFVLTRYNRSYYYAMAVIELGKAICFSRTSLKENNC